MNICYCGEHFKNSRDGCILVTVGSCFVAVGDFTIVAPINNGNYLSCLRCAFEPILHNRLLAQVYSCLITYSCVWNRGIQKVWINVGNHFIEKVLLPNLSQRQSHVKAFFFLILVEGKICNHGND